jgi:hypothetical protein
MIIKWSSGQMFRWLRSLKHSGLTNRSVQWGKNGREDELTNKSVLSSGYSVNWIYKHIDSTYIGCWHMNLLHISSGFRNRWKWTYKHISSNSKQTIDADADTDELTINQFIETNNRGIDELTIDQFIETNDKCIDEPTTD